MKNKYGFGKEVSYSFDTSIEKVTKALEKEGFGVLTDIDVSATLKKKLNLDIPPYRILGACNPKLAHRALEAEPTIGLLLPCNVVVRVDQDHKTYIEFMDPEMMNDLSNNPKIILLAKEVKERLQRVLGEI